MTSNQNIIVWCPFRSFKWAAMIRISSVCLNLAVRQLKIIWVFVIFEIKTCDDIQHMKVFSQFNKRILIFFFTILNNFDKLLSRQILKGENGK